MATTVGSHAVAAFVNPSNGDALDATVVKGNDNTLRTAYVNHDADSGVHFQSSVLASRPAAGVAGRKWLTTDDGPKVWYDTGSVWAEIGYVPTVGTASLTNVTISGTLAVDTTTLVVDAANNRVGVGTATPGVTFDVVGAARVSNALTVTAGGITVTGNSTITGTLGGLTGLTVASGGITVTGNSTITGTLGGLTGVTVTGTVTATTFSGSGASLTNLPAAEITGTLPAISGANLTSLNASNISSGTLNNARLPSTIGATNATQLNGLNLTVTNEIQAIQGMSVQTGSPIAFEPNSGSPFYSLAFDTANAVAAYFDTGSTSLPSLNNAPTGMNSWEWLRISYNNTDAYIPVAVN